MFSLLLRGFFGAEHPGALHSRTVGAKATFSFSRAPGMERMEPQKSRLPAEARQRSRCTGRGKESGAASGSTRGRPGALLGMADSFKGPVDGCSQLLSASPQFLRHLPYKRQCLYYVIHWKCTEQRENSGTDEVVN